MARQGIAVHVFEAADRVNDAPRAATTHAATLEMLDELGLVEDVIRRGLVEPLFRTWDRSTCKLMMEVDFGRLKDDTRYPFAVQCEQHKLAGMAIARLRDFARANVEFSARVSAVLQTSDDLCPLSMQGNPREKVPLAKIIETETNGQRHFSLVRVRW